MKAITGLDATFLYTETPTSPMHVGSVAILEGSLSFEDFKDTIASRIHLIPKFRQRLVQVPFNIDYPYWVDDPNFDLNLHMKRVALPKPGAWAELREVASNYFSEALDRSRPLWDFLFIEGIDGIAQVPKGSVAIVSKVHHVAIDGMAGAGIMAIMFDFGPKAKKPKKPLPYEPKPLPNSMSLIWNSAVGFASAPLKLPKVMVETLTAGLKLGFISQTQHIKPPVAPFTAPSSPLNRIISARRKWNSAILSFDRIKALKNIMGTTFNDVILAICSGALRKYLLEKKKLPLKSLVAMVPVSTRAKSDKGTSGNQVSSMLVQLATQIEDPIKRLEAIYENTVRSKTYQDALGAKTLAKMTEAVPFGIANQAAQLYSRFKISEMHNPVFNVTITNVPGPQMPFYLNGHKLISFMGMAPIIDGMGLIITVLSYNGSVTISPTSDANTMPDIDVFTRYIRESANELEALILEKSEQEAKAKESSSTQAESLDFASFFKEIKQYFKDNKEAFANDKAIFQVHIQNGKEEATDWKIDLSKDIPTVRQSGASKPDLTLTIRDVFLKKVLKGDLDLPTSVVQGRAKVEGNERQLAILNKVFSKVIPFSL